MKATVSIYSLTTWTPVTVSLANLLPQIGRTERKTFPHNEAIAFENELQKRNFELTIVVKITPAESQPELVAYVGIARMKGTALLHKMCVVKNFRCQGIATKVLLMRCEQLRLQGCNIIQPMGRRIQGACQTIIRETWIQIVPENRELLCFWEERYKDDLAITMIRLPPREECKSGNGHPLDPPPETLQHHNFGTLL